MRRTYHHVYLSAYGKKQIYSIISFLSTSIALPTRASIALGSQEFPVSRLSTRILSLILPRTEHSTLLRAAGWSAMGLTYYPLLIGAPVGRGPSVPGYVRMLAILFSRWNAQKKELLFSIHFQGFVFQTYVLSLLLLPDNQLLKQIHNVEY